MAEQRIRMIKRFLVLLVLLLPGWDLAVAAESSSVINDAEAPSLAAPAVRNSATIGETLFKWGPVVPASLLIILATWLIRESRSRKAAEQEQRDIEEQINIISDFDSDWDSWLDSGGHLRHVNPAVEPICCGYSVQECREMKDYPRSLIEEDDLHIYEDLLVKAQKNEAVDNLPLLVRHKDGHLVWVEMSSNPIVTPAGKYLGVRICARDISEQETADAERDALVEIFKQGPISIIITDAEGRIKYSNPYFHQLTGYSFKEALGKNPRILNAGITPSETYRELWSTIVSGETWQGEFVNRKKNGDLYIENVWIRPAFDSEGKITSYVAVKEDITERKAAEKRLRESEAFLAKAQKIARLGGWQWNISENSMVWSDEMFAVFGFDPKRFKPSFSALMSVVHPDDVKLVRESTEHALQTHESFALEYRIVLSNGGMRTVYAQVEIAVNPAGEATHAIGIVQDITERKEMEALIRKREDVFQKILNASQAGIIVLDANTRKTIECNQAALDLTGFSREEMVGAVCSDTFCFAGCKSCPVLGKAAEAYTFERRVRRKDGSAMPAIKTVTLNNFDGREVLIESFVDATKLEEAIGKAEAASLAKSRFLANMSHEIRTPMNAVLGYAQVLDRDADLSDRQHEYIGIIHRSGNHLLTLIDEILEFSTIEAGHVEIRQDRFDLPALLDDLEQMFRMKVEVKGLKLNIAWDKNLPRYLQSDADKILQVLINLLENAIKFTDQGAITIRVQCEEPEEASPSSGRFRICVEVQDSGCGIPASDIPLVYEVFEQSVAGRHRGGSGLGLAICRQYARLLGGDLTASSKEGIGSTFRFCFMAKPGQPDGTSRSIPPGKVVGLAPGAKACRILIVDDHEDNRAVLGEILSSVGFKIDMAVDGEQALEYFQRRKYDLVLMDRRLPGMDGLEAVRRLRALPEGSRIGILMVSASAMEEDRLQAVAGGVDGFLRKPVRECDLFEQVQSLLDIDYVYEAPSVAHRQKPMALTQKEVRAKLPKESISALYDAVESGDAARFRSLLENLPEPTAGVASEFRRLIQSYEYEKIMELLCEE